MRLILWNPDVADYLRGLGASADVIAFIHTIAERKPKNKIAIDAEET